MAISLIRSGAGRHTDTPRNGLQRSILFCVLPALAIFALGLVTPQGVAEFILYVVVVLISLLSSERRIVFSTLILCTLLTIAGFLLSTESPEVWHSLVNRTLAIGAFWIVGLIGLKHLQMREEMRSLHADLESRVAENAAELRLTNEQLEAERSQLKQTEAALRQSDERFKLMTWATKDAVWDWDLQTNQIWWGEGLQKVFHYSADMTRTDPDWRLEHIHLEDRDKVSRAIDQALEGGLEFWSKEYRFQRKDGTFADIMDRGYILRDDLGRPYRMIGAMMDVTERKYMDKTLLQANEQLRQFLNELQRRNHEIALLNEMSHLLQVCQTAEEAYGIIANKSNELFPRTAGALYLVNPARTLVRAVAVWGELSSAEQMFVPDDCLALRRGQTHLLNEQQAILRCLHLPNPPPAVSYCLPMQAQGETLGVLHVQSPFEENLDEAKLQLAYTVVEQAGMALSNLKLREALREQSIRDPLTGLYNRRYMEEVLKQHLSRATRHLHPLGIIMIDIDHFKLFNDTHGHPAGDALLRELGRFVQSHIRGEDIACRYGGEEFTLIMPDASLEAARQRAELLRQMAGQLRWRDAGQPQEAITLSAGVAIYPQHGRTMETVLRSADAALYRAKQEGRDRVIVAERVY